MTTILGIDEAGRGPIIGPLVMCGILIEEGEEKDLIKLKVKDSKLLSATQRERIYERLVKMFKYKIVHISPKEIDNSVDGEYSNLNWLEAEKAIIIINELKPDKVIMDCPSPNIKAYTSFIQERLTCKPELLCAHHADTDFPVVGAASIIAKVTRDAEIKIIKKELGKDFGSGYMADPKTKDFMRAHWESHEHLFRHSWAPYKKQRAEKKQKTLGSFKYPDEGIDEIPDDK